MIFGAGGEKLWNEKVAVAPNEGGSVEAAFRNRRTANCMVCIDVVLDIRRGERNCEVLEWSLGDQREWTLKHQTPK